MIKSINCPTSWADITLEIFEKIIEISNNERLNDIERETELVKVIVGLEQEDLDNMTIQSYQSIVGKLTFISKPVQNVLPKDEITLNGKQYDVLLYPLKMTAAQFIDYKSLLSLEDTHKKAAKICAVFITPKGSKYGDGSYDFEELIDEIYKYMSIEYVNGLCFFLKAQYVAYMTAFLESSVKVLSKEKSLPKEKKDQILSQINKLKTIISNGGHMA